MRSGEEACPAAGALGETRKDRGRPKTKRTAKKGSHDCFGRSATDFPAPSERPAGQNGQLDERRTLQLRADRGSVSPRADLEIINS